MSEAFNSLELLAPARDLEVGLAAIGHGADAVYIGGPAFGARAAAGNSMSDIEKLATAAHRVHARVFLALNTICFDNEVPEALRVARQAYEAGVDALIVQDLGLLEAGLPPMEIHASTQCDIRTPQKAALMDALGFSQVVLAREMTLAEIAACRKAMPNARIEFFVHGALCVSYSGRCYLSCAQTGRSANRGACAQPCRLPYDVYDLAGREIVHARHVLSLKDNDQSANLKALIAAGVSSFKIEGRLKDAEYVKNITAYYRRRLDAIIEGSDGALRAESLGRTQFFFTPDPQKTFHRSATDYFVNGRQIMIAALDTPKSTGERLGLVKAVHSDGCDKRGRAASAGRDRNVRPREPESLDIATTEEIANGDGLIYFDSKRNLCGLNVNRAQRISPTLVRVYVHEGLGTHPDLRPGVEISRNKDRAFARILAGKSAERRIAADFELTVQPDAVVLTARAAGTCASAVKPFTVSAAKNPMRGLAAIEGALKKTGETLFCFGSLAVSGTAEGVAFGAANPPFVPVSVLNALRREALEKLEASVAASHPAPTVRPMDLERARSLAPLCALSGFGANAANRETKELLEKLGVTGPLEAFEVNGKRIDLSHAELMRCRHCIRHTLGLCPKTVKGDPAKKEAMKRMNGGRLKPLPLVLVNDKGRRLIARFDCRHCEMTVSLIENDAQFERVRAEAGLKPLALS